MSNMCSLEENFRGFSQSTKVDYLFVCHWTERCVSVFCHCSVYECFVYIVSVYMMMWKSRIDSSYSLSYTLHIKHTAPTLLICVLNVLNTLLQNSYVCFCFEFHCSWGDLSFIYDLLLDELFIFVGFSKYLHWKFIIKRNQTSSIIKKKNQWKHLSAGIYFNAHRIVIYNQDMEHFRDQIWNIQFRVYFHHWYMLRPGF